MMKSVSLENVFLELVVYLFRNSIFTQRNKAKQSKYFVERFLHRNDVVNMTEPYFWFFPIVNSLLDSQINGKSRVLLVVSQIVSQINVVSEIGVFLLHFLELLQILGQLTGAVLLILLVDDSFSLQNFSLEYRLNIIETDVSALFEDGNSVIQCHLDCSCLQFLALCILLAQYLDVQIDGVVLDAEHFVYDSLVGQLGTQGSDEVDAPVDYYHSCHVSLAFVEYKVALLLFCLQNLDNLFCRLSLPINVSYLSVNYLQSLNTLCCLLVKTEPAVYVSVFEQEIHFQGKQVAFQGNQVEIEVFYLQVGVNIVIFYFFTAKDVPSWPKYQSVFFICKT